MRISEDYIITTDGSNNIMLNERIYKPIYEKQLQKDKNGKTKKSMFKLELKELIISK